MWVKLVNPPLRDPFEYILNLEANPHSLLSFPWTFAPQIICDKILFSHTRSFFISFSFGFLLFYVFINFYKNHFIIIIILFIYFHENYFYFLMFRNVPEFSGMFRNVPACSGMFHVPGFIDTPFVLLPCLSGLEITLSWL